MLDRMFYCVYNGDSKESNQVSTKEIYEEQVTV